MPAMSALLERGEELAAIERALASAGSGEGGLITIEGEAGAGKTALLDVAGQRGEGMQMRALRARGGEFERDFAYGVVRQLFEPPLAESAGGELLCGHAAAAAQIFEPITAPGSAADPLAVQHGLHHLCLALADARPLLMLVDDAQWADLASLQALAYLGRRIAGTHSALILTVRTGEPGGHEALLDELRREPLAVTVEPSPLSAAATATLVAEETGSEPAEGFAVACREATAGNPFLLVELLRALDSERIGADRYDPARLSEVAAAGVSSMILIRLARLGEDAVAVARAVAVLEPHAEARRIAALCDLSLDSVARACEALVVARLFFDARPPGFVHPLVRAAVLSELPATRLAADHTRIARLLAEDDADADAVAAHLLLAEPSGDEWAVAELRGAAAAALGRGAPAAAVSYLRRALREPPLKADRRAVSRELGLALIRDDDPEGVEVLRAVRAAETDPIQRAVLAAELATSLALRRPGEEGFAMLEESLREIPDRHSGIGLLLRGHQMTQVLNGMERIPRGLDPGPGGWPDGGTMEGRFLLRALAYLYAIGFGEMGKAGELLERTGCLRHCESDMRAGLPTNASSATMILIDRGDLTTAFFENAVEIAEQLGSITALAAANGVQAWCLLGDGDLGGAWTSAEVAVRLTEPTGLDASLAAWLACALRILVAQGEDTTAEELLDRIWRGREAGPGIPGALLLIGRGELRLERGLHAEARHDFLAAGERVRWLPYANPEALGWRTGLALAEDRLGNRDVALRMAEEALRLAEKAGGERGIGIVLRVLGTLSEGEEAIEILRRAERVLGRTRARSQHAFALVELGSALRRANRRREAREPLREALDLAHRCGAVPLEERARTELKATGARPRKAVLTGVESLTPSELRVARLAAEGKTNAEIAQSLFVTAKTIETHLRHVYQKLDITGRGQLPPGLKRDRKARAIPAKGGMAVSPGSARSGND